MADDVQVRFSADVSNLVGGIGQINDAISTVSNSLKALAALAGVALTFEGLKSSFNDLAAFADEVQNTQAKVGGTIQSMTLFSGVATMAGVSFKSLADTYSSATTQLARAAVDGFDPTNKALATFGISAKSLIGIPVDEFFNRIAGAVSKFNPSIALANNVRTAFGAGMVEMIPTLIKGSEEFGDLQEAVEKAQKSLASALPGISETNEKLTLMSISSKAFAASVFTALKPAIDAAIDGFVKLTSSVSVETIRNVANQVANVLIDIAASVAGFFVRASAEIDNFTGKLDSLRPRVGFDLTIDGPAEALITWLAKISGNYDKLKDDLSKPLKFSIGEADSGGAAPSLDVMNDRLRAIQESAEAAHTAINNMIPVSGTWQAAAQDLAQLNREVTSLADNFTRMNAKDVLATTGTTAGIKAINEEIKTLQEGLQRQTILLEQGVAQYRLTEGEKVEAVRKATDETYALQLEALNRELALANKSADQRQLVLNKISELENKYATATVKINGDAAAAVQKQWEDITNALQGAFNAQLRGMLAGTTSFAQGFRNILGDMVIYGIEAIEKLAVKWLIKEATELTATQATEAAKVAASTAATTAGIAAQTAAATAAIQRGVAATFANASAWFALSLGPAAPAAAAAVSTEVEATSLGLLATSAEQGEYQVRAGLYNLHDDEAVLPAPAAQAFRDLAEGGGLGGGSHLHLHGQLIDGPSLARFARDNASLFAGALKNFAQLNPRG